MAKRKANVGTSFGFGRHLLLAITTLLVLSPHSEASLVISIYNNNAVYLASDSLLTPGLDESKKINGPKIFMVSTNFCVTMTGLFGNPITNTNHTPSGLFTLSDKLKGFCDEEYPQAKPLGAKIMAICDNFQTAHKNYLEKLKSAGVSLSPDHQETVLYFAGYDSLQTNFAGVQYVFGTNMTSQGMFERGANNFEAPIAIFGEADFLSAIDSTNNDLRLKEIRSKLPDTFMQMWDETPLSEKEMTDLILQLFQLHKTYAASFIRDEGNIGEPYVIYKITKDRVGRIH